MGGKGAPRDTLFGLIGRTGMDPLTRSLGGLVITTTTGEKAGMPSSSSPLGKNTEHHLVGAKSRTAIPGVHMGQVPFAGMYMKAVGAEVS
jgi:hypothetical protein